MSKLPIQESTPFVAEQGPLLETGEIYEAEITGFNAYEGRYGPGLAWRLAVDSPDHDNPVEAVIFTTKSTFIDGDINGAKTSNLIKYGTTFNGGELFLDDDGDLEYELLVGKRARIIAATYPDKNNPSIMKNKATNVLPLKRAKSAV